VTGQPEQRKTRRRFIADMLFLGGGLTAAGLLAKSQFLDPESAAPVVAGKMSMPPASSATPMSTPVPSCTKAPDAPLEIPPEVEGNMKLPPPDKVPEPSPRPNQPVYPGQREAPRHEPRKPVPSQGTKPGPAVGGLVAPPRQ
jgi:hypothetical protein